MRSRISGSSSAFVFLIEGFGKALLGELLLKLLSSMSKEARVRVGVLLSDAVQFDFVPVLRILSDIKHGDHDVELLIEFLLLLFHHVEESLVTSFNLGLRLLDHLCELVLSRVDLSLMP